MNILSVLDFMKTIDWYWWVGIIAVLIIIWFILGKYEWFKRVVYDLVVKAEQEIVGYKKGNERFKFVVNAIQSVIPLVLRGFFTEKRIVNIIEWAVGEMKKGLEKGGEKDE